MTEKEKRILIARMTEIRELIAEFGLTLRGHDPGISAGVKDENGREGSLQFDGWEWWWLEPLLKELRDFRKDAQE